MTNVLNGRIQAMVSIQDHELLIQLKEKSGRTVGALASQAVHAWLIDNYKKEMTTYQYAKYSREEQT